MQYFLIFIQILPYLLKLVKAAEAFFPDAGAGADKKAAVTEATKIILEGGTELSTGGQKDTWEKLAPLVSTVIDSAAGLYFPSSNPRTPPDAG